MTDYHIKESEVNLQPDQIGKVNKMLRSCGEGGRLVLEVTKEVDERANTGLWSTTTPKNQTKSQPTS